MLTAFQKSAFQVPGFQIQTVSGVDRIKQRRRRELNYYLDSLMADEEIAARERADVAAKAEAKRRAEQHAREQRALLTLATQSRNAFSRVAPVLSRAA